MNAKHRQPRNRRFQRQGAVRLTHMNFRRQANRHHLIGELARRGQQPGTQRLCCGQIPLQEGAFGLFKMQDKCLFIPDIWRQQSASRA